MKKAVVFGSGQPFDEWNLFLRCSVPVIHLLTVWEKQLNVTKRNEWHSVLAHVIGKKLSWASSVFIDNTAAQVTPVVSMTRNYSVKCCWKQRQPYCMKPDYICLENANKLKKASLALDLWGDNILVKPMPQKRSVVNENSGIMTIGLHSFVNGEQNNLIYNIPWIFSKR